LAACAGRDVGNGEFQGVRVVLNGGALIGQMVTIAGSFCAPFRKLLPSTAGVADEG